MARPSSVRQRSANPARQRCGCGSGRRFARCCGASVAAGGGGSIPAREAIAEATRQIQRGDTTAAAVTLDRVLAAIPDHPQALFLQGYATLLNGDAAAAVERIDRALGAGLRDPAAHYHLANACVRLNRLPDAERALLRATGRKRDFRDAWRRLVEVRLAMGHAAAAYEAAREAHALSPLAATQWDQLAAALHRAGADDRALEALDVAVRSWPDNPDLHATLAGVLTSLNRLDEAQDAVDRALRLDGDHVFARLVAARLLRRNGRLEEARAALARMPGDADTDAAIRAQVHWERVKLHERLDEPDAAFEAAQRMNRAARESRPPAGTFDEVDSRLAAIEAGLAEQAGPRGHDACSDPGPQTPRPLFILGFPRTGTTVLEMLLAQHPAVAAAGESRAIPGAEALLAADGIAPQRCIDTPPSREATARIAKARKVALATLRADSDAGGDTAVIVDKYPLNALHVTTIGVLFPGAMIVRMVRHPVDTAISCHFQLFGNDDAWHTSLPQTCRFLARVDEHLARVRDRLPLDWIDLRLEDAIAAPEATVNTIIERQGLAPLAAPLRLDGDASYLTRTASHEQVRGRVTDTHLQRRRAYRRFVDAHCRSLLAGMCERWGYDPQAGQPDGPVSG